MDENCGKTYKWKVFKRENTYLANKVAAHPSILNEIKNKHQGCKNHKVLDFLHRNKRITLFTSNQF